MPDSQLTRILAIRHGETSWNVDRRIQGHLDVPLNERGQWQARRLERAVADEGLDALYASDLVRAYETAEAVARGSGRPIVTDTGLRERCFGIFEGQTYREIELVFPDESERWKRRDPDFAPPRGETLAQFYERVVATATRLAHAHLGQSIALVAHGGVLDCLYRAAARIDLSAPRSWSVGNATLNRLLYTPQGFTLVGWSDASHLDGPALDEESDGGIEAEVRRA